VPEVSIEKCNIRVTVRDVADLNGNTMASPVTKDLYVYKSPLRWSEKHIDLSTEYGVESSFDVNINNLSGKTKNYSIEGLPLWISASKTSGRLTALNDETITFTVSPYINVGDFDEIIYLVTDDGMTEPLPINVSVRDAAPQWEVEKELVDKNIAMHIVARVVIDGEVAHDPDDMLGVFGKNHRLLGVTKLDVNNSNNANEAVAYLTVYNDTQEATRLHFDFWDASQGRIFTVDPQLSYISFKSDEILGSASSPTMLYNTSEEMQRVALEKGWNWVSLYVQPKKAKARDLLDASTAWAPGDAIEVVYSNGSTKLMTYKTLLNGDSCYWDGGDEEVAINPRLMYRFYSTNKKDAYLKGSPTTARITVKKGWNRIGYVSSINLPVANALGDYTDDGTDGDMIKSQSEFAVLSIDAQGNRTWKGTLKYMKAGEGYMLRRMGEGSVTFDYPTYNDPSRYSSSGTPNVKFAAPLYVNTTGVSMNMIATVDGIGLQEGDRLVAYCDGEVCGMAEPDEEQRFFISLGQYGSGDVSFAIEREGNIIAMSPATMPYQANGTQGTLSAPAVINFMPMAETDGDAWYTLQGIKLAKRPARPGVYLHGGKTVIVK